MNHDRPLRKSTGLALDPADIVWLQGLARALLRDVGRADDLVQDTVVAALRSHAGDVQSKRSWLRAVAQKLALRQQRDEARRRDHERLAARQGAAPSSAVLVAAAEAAEKVALVARSLEEPYRGAVLEKYLEGASVQEIAERSGVKADTIRWRLRRGLELMRSELSQLQPQDEQQPQGQWALALLPLASLPGSKAALSSASTAASIPTAIMSTKTLALTAAAIIVAGVFWTQFSPTAPLNGVDVVQPEEAQLPSVVTAAPNVVERVEIERPAATAVAGPEEPVAEAKGPDLAGRVVDERGRGIEGATVYFVEPHEDDAQRALSHPRTVTDGRGRFSFSGLAPWFERHQDEVHLRAVANGYLRSEGLPVSGEQSSGELELVLFHGLSLEGRVVDTDGQPLGGLPLWVHSPFVGDDSVSMSRVLASAAVNNLSPRDGWPHHQCEGTTSNNGSITFRGLATGDYVVRSLDPSWEILEPRIAQGGDVGLDWVASSRFSVHLIPRRSGANRRLEDATPFLDRARMRASCRVKLDLDDGSSVDTGQWFGWGNGEVTFTLTQSLVPDQELAEVSKAQFYGTATLDGEEVEWRSPTIYRRRLGRKTTPDVVVKFKGRPAGQKPGAEGELRSESDRASARDALVEFDVRYRGSGAPFSGRLSIDWIHSPKDSAASRGDSRGKRLPSGRYQANVPVGSVTFTLKDASASGSLPSWTGAASTKRSGKTLVFAELDEGAVVDVQRPKGWRGEWFVRASYRENPDDPWFGSWNYSSPTSSLQLTSLKPAEWRFQLRRSSNGASEETRTAVLVPGDSVVVE